MIYYAAVGDVYYRCFSFDENYSRGKNSFLKLSFIWDPKGHKKGRTIELTVHPDIIARKTTFPKNTKLYGDYKDKERKVEQETLYPFGYRTLRKGLVKLFDNNPNGGFFGTEEYSQNNLRRDHKIINFPDDPYRPYWIGVFFTTYTQGKIEKIFKAEDLDEIIYISGSEGNFVVLLKFIIPEWETLGISPDDKMRGWVHPTFILEKLYFECAVSDT